MQDSMRLGTIQRSSTNQPPKLIPRITLTPCCASASGNASKSIRDRIFVGHSLATVAITAIDEVHETATRDDATSVTRLLFLFPLKKGHFCWFTLRIKLKTLKTQNTKHRPYVVVSDKSFLVLIVDKLKKCEREKKKP